MLILPYRCMNFNVAITDLCSCSQQRQRAAFDVDLSYLFILLVFTCGFCCSCKKFSCLRCDFEHFFLFASVGDCSFGSWSSRADRFFTDRYCSALCTLCFQEPRYHSHCNTIDLAVLHPSVVPSQLQSWCYSFMIHTRTLSSEAPCSLFDPLEPDYLWFVSEINDQSHRIMWEDGKFCFPQSLSLQSDWWKPRDICSCSAEWHWAQWRLPGILLSGFGAWGNSQCCMKERWEDLIQLCRHDCRIVPAVVLLGFLWNNSSEVFAAVLKGDGSLHNLMDHLIRKQLAVLSAYSGHSHTLETE